MLPKTRNEKEARKREREGAKKAVSLNWLKRVIQFLLQKRSFEAIYSLLLFYRLAKYEKCVGSIF